MKLMKSTVFVLAVIMAFTSAVTAQAGDVRGDRVVKERVMNRARELAFLLAPVKTKEDLDGYLEELRQNPEAWSPLNLLSPAARDRFLNSLVFTERGLGGYQYGDLQAQLTASQIYRLLSLFGAQHTTPLIRGARVEGRADEIIMQEIAPEESGDYKDYKCVSPANCYTWSGFICMHSC